MGRLDDSSESVLLKLSVLGNSLKIPHTAPIPTTPVFPKLKPFILYVSSLAKKKQPDCQWFLLVLSYCGTEGLWPTAHKAGVRAGLYHYFRLVAGVGKVTGGSPTFGADLGF